MKSNLLRAVVIVALTCVALIIWRHTHSTASEFRELPELSRADFKEIQRATRQAMWQKAFPAGAWWSKIDPRAVWRLATTRIRQIEVMGGRSVQVQTRSPSGDYFYYLVNDSSSSGKWRIISAGVGPQIHVEGGWGPDVVIVDGGLGLIGGSLSTGPDEEFLNSFLRRDAGGGSTTAGQPSLWKPARLTYERLQLDQMSGVENSTNRPTFSEKEFSNWLSNWSALNLR